MKILGIETSCDETAVAVIDTKGENINVLSNVISSQIKLHAKYGGVVPNLAAREHAKNIKHVFETALKEAKIKDFKKEIDLIAVTRGPGLGPALLIGLTFAKTLAWIYKKPIVGVNHMEGHIYSNWLPPIGITNYQSLHKLGTSLPITKNTFPALNILVSGGHTELVLMRDHGKYQIIGETLDDAVGEAFDKVARMLGLGYPGGPAIAQRAMEFKIQNLKFKIQLPRPMLNSKNLDFSYSGLKTAVLYLIRDLKVRGIDMNSPEVISEIAYEFQEAATDVLVQKTAKAIKLYKVKSLLLSGGVSANKVLRHKLQNLATEAGIKYFCPAMEYTGDNAAMVAAAGYFAYKKNKNPSSHEALKGVANYESVIMDANLSF